jgi:type IV secretory pathway VirB10-like protein
MSTPMQNWMPRKNLLQRACRIGVPMLLYGAASIASAQWAWRDEHGRTVYSDQPPPANIRAADLLQQPSSPAQPPESTDATAQPSPNSAPAQPPPNSTASAAPRPPTTAEREQEFRKRMKEHADAEKKVADGQAQAAQKADDCQRARGYIKSLEDGVRLVRTNPDGSRELLDEAQRAAEAQRTREIIETRCN